MRACILVVSFAVACGGDKQPEKSEPPDKTTTAEDAAPLPPVDGVNRPSVPRSTPRAAIYLRQSTGGKGLVKEIVHRITRRYIARFKVCYDKGLAANPSLAGVARASFQVTADGRTSDVAVTGLDDKAVTSCLVEMFRAIQFPSADGREDVAASINLELWGATNSNDIEVRHRDSGRKAPEHAEVARHELHRGRPLLASCYDRGRRDGASPGDKAWVTFSLEKDGAPVDVAAGGLGVSSVETCIVDAVKQLSFLGPKGADASVSLAITFPR